MTDQVTQCPECQTAFRVTEEQIQVANGAVRCGNCESVFNAQEHWVGSDAAGTLDATGAPQERSAEEALSETYINEILHEEPALAGMAPVANHYIADSSMEDLPGYSDINAAPSSEEVQFSNEFLELTSSTDSPGYASTNQASTDPASQDSAPSSDSIAASTDSELTLEADGSEDEDSGLEKTDQLDELTLAATEEESFEQEILLAADPIAPKEELLANIEAAPVEMVWQRVSRGRTRQTEWIGAIVLSAVLLVSQYVTVNFDTLARTKQYRPWFETLCSFSGCELPVQFDVRQIQSSNLLVRSHPNRQDALVVDTIMTNQARFQQPFPILELEFTDLNGQQVAVRQFEPTDYLGGEMSGAQTMPSRQPIHISLEILDPGETAVNYAVRLYPNT